MRLTADLKTGIRDLGTESPESIALAGKALSGFADGAIAAASQSS